jgi:3-methyl-2-oxobutanoate hydroxymethyltransferase
MSSLHQTKRLTTRQLRKLKGKRPICCLTAYDHPGALVCARAGVELILVGDSLGNVVQGRADTLGVTLEQLLYHTTLVDRALQQLAHDGSLQRLPMLVADLPFLTFHTTPAEAVANAGRCLAEGGAQAVKLEWRPGIDSYTRTLTEAGIPVMGHLGLTPQAVHQLGGYRVQGRGDADAELLLNEIRKLEAAGAFAVVLELVPRELAARLTAAVDIPTIGIGAGPSCDGQILVFHDLLGLGNAEPKHVKRYLEGAELFEQAVGAYIADVREGKFPGVEQSFD